MPIYAYRCEACGHAHDALQKVSDPPLTVCPNCGEAALRKQLTAAGFQLKGSGWYVTDFRGDGKTKKEAADAADKAPADGAAAAAPATPAAAAAPAEPAKAETATTPSPTPAAAPPPASSSS